MQSEAEAEGGGLTLTLLVGGLALFGGQLDFAWPFCWVLGLLGWASRLNTPLLKRPLIWIWLAFYGLLVTQWLVAGYFERGVVYVPDTCLPFSVFGNIALGTIGGWLMVGALEYVDTWDKVIRPMVLLAVILAIQGIIQHYTGNGKIGWVIPYGKEFFGIFPYVNNAGIFFVLMSAVVLDGDRKWWWLVGLFGYCCWLTGTRYAAPCFAILVIWRSNVRLLVPVVLGLGLWWFCPNLVDNRLPEYRNMVKVWMEFPVFGVGAWGFAAFVPGQAFGVFDGLMWLCEYGVVGVVILVVIFWDVLKRFRLESVLDAGVLCVVGQSLIDMPFRHVGILILCMVIVGRARKGRSYE